MNVFWTRTPELPDTPLDAVRYVVFDTELTSLDKRTNRLLSVGALAMDGARIRLGEQFYRVVNPGVDVPAPGVLIHGLRPVDVAQGGEPAGVIAELAGFMEGAVPVGHFLTIDLGILRKESGNVPAGICTARVHQWLLRNLPTGGDIARQVEQIDLPSVARYWKVEARDAHHSLGDAWVTALIWQRMIHSLKRAGVTTLAGLGRKVGLVS